MKIVKCHLVVLKMWCNIIILHWNDFLHWYICTCGVKLPVFFYCKKDFQKRVCSIFGYNTRSMRNNRSIARGSNTSNIFAVTKHTLVLKWQLVWQSIVISIWLSMNDDVNPKRNNKNNGFQSNHILYVNIFIFLINYQCYIGCRGYKLCHHNYNLETIMGWYLAPFLVHKAKS